MKRDLGRCFVTNVDVKLGQVRKWPRRMARRRVEICGLRALAWRYLARSCFVLARRMRLFACCDCGSLGCTASGWVGGGMGMCHSPLELFLLPVMMAVPFLKIFR